MELLSVKSWEKNSEILSAATLLEESVSPYIILNKKQIISHSLISLKSKKIKIVF
jgi:hypothetical protein